MNANPPTPRAHLRLLLVEDSEDDARLLYSELKQSSNDITYKRVDTEEDMRAALNDADWDIVISDHSLPRFSSLEALQVLKEYGKDIPFIIYSGEVSKHVAVAAMNSGAQDSIHKGDFALLLPAIERELLGASMRRAKEKADAEVHRLAFYDNLTGLPNRNLFHNHVRRKLQRADGRASAVFVLDIDRFLRINNCYGYKFGDALIKQIGQRLQECLPPEAMLARLGSDEFAAFLGEVSGEEKAREAAENIRQAFQRPFVQGGLQFHLSVSIGIAASLREDEDVPELLINAETAMFLAKSRGGNSYQVYAREMGAIAGKQLILENALRGSVERGELILEYQPSLSVVSGKMTGVEALVRWQHPELGLLMPEDFIPLANETGLITEIGKWVLQTACRQAKAWHDAGHAGLTMAVNLSAVQFWQPGLVQTVAEALADSGMDPCCLELEITETVLMRDADATTATLHALKELKVRIAIDDFGTGYSSLSYLRRFPIDILKIDKSFSCESTRNAETEAIVQAVGTLGRSLGMVTVAEGVETAEQLQLFQKQQYDRVQGFLFSVPRVAGEISAMMEARPTSPPMRPIADTRGRGSGRRVGQFPTREFAGGVV